MHPVVSENFFDWSMKFEGYVLWPYLDVKGLVTIGVGNLIDPVSAAASLPFVLADGSPASRDKICADWANLKKHQGLAKYHYNAAAAFTQIRLTELSVRQLVTSKLSANWAFMRAHYFPHADEWPAAAQLAVSSMAWAVGAGFPTIFKNFTHFAQLADWADSDECCAINAKGNAGVIPRNVADKALLLYASNPDNDPETLPMQDGVIMMPEIEIVA